MSLNLTSFAARVGSRLRAVTMPNATDIEHRLREAEALLPDLERNHRSLAFDAESGLEGAASALAETLAALTAGRERVQNLRAALAEAQQREAAKLSADRDAIRQSQVASVRSHLQRRDAAAVAFAEAQARAIEAWHELVHHSEAAAAACPIGTEWPAGVLTTFGELREATKHELFRVGGDATLGNRRSFPGGHTPSIMLQNNPAAIPALVDQVRQASEYVMAKLAGLPVDRAA